MLGRLAALASAAALTLIFGGAAAQPVPAWQDPVIAAAGDIACDPGSSRFKDGNGTASACRQKYTARLLRGVDAVLPLGDIQYEDGRFDKFKRSYALSWGAYRRITHPVPGNHDYLTNGAAGYYRYFGASAGSPAKGYYSFDLGRWHLVALNSECRDAGGCRAGSAQERWLRRDLAATRMPCILAYWHHPRFSSGHHGNDEDYEAFWQALYAVRADVVLVGHDHNYERFALQDPRGRRDPAGIREFVVGTGGKGLRPFETIRANSQIRDANTFGVLKLTLRPSAYTWRFVAERGTFTDSGSGRCHRKRPGRPIPRQGDRA